MVFIRPTIVRNPQDAYGITAPRYDLMRGRQSATEGKSSLEENVGAPRAPAPPGNAPP
jgi:type II secretory pathway component GspD/PulD (secretin)